MSGRILVTAPDGTVTEGGDPNPYNTRPRNPVWNRFTLRFADGGSLVLLDPRRLGPGPARSRHRRARSRRHAGHAGLSSGT